MQQAKFSRPPYLGAFVALGKHAYSDCARGLRDRSDPPRFRTDESMRRRFGIVRLASKPRKTDRHSSTDRVSVFPLRLRAEKKYLAFAGRLPGRHMRAVQIHLAYTFGSGDADFGQSAVSSHHFGNAGNFKA